MINFSIFFFLRLTSGPVSKLYLKIEFFGISNSFF